MGTNSKKPRKHPGEGKTRQGAKARRAKSLSELATEQGKTGPQDYHALLGAGADLWDSDANFEAFLEGLRESRHTGG